MTTETFYKIDKESFKRNRYHIFYRRMSFCACFSYLRYFHISKEHKSIAIEVELNKGNISFSLLRKGEEISSIEINTSGLYILELNDKGWHHFKIKVHYFSGSVTLYKEK